MTTPSKSVSSSSSGGQRQIRSRRKNPPLAELTTEDKGNGEAAAEVAPQKDVWNSLLAEWGVDPKLSEEGVWITDPRNEKISYLVARLNMTRQRDKMLKIALQEGFSDLEELDAKKRREMLSRVLSETVLMDWRGVSNGADGDVSYTPERGLQMLLDERMEEWTEWLMAESLKRDHYRSTQVREDGKK